MKIFPSIFFLYIVLKDLLKTLIVGTLEPPQQGSSNQYPQLCFGSKQSVLDQFWIKKDCIPLCSVTQFYCIKVRNKGVHTTLTRFPDAFSDTIIFLCYLPGNFREATGCRRVKRCPAFIVADIHVGIVGHQELHHIQIVVDTCL